jgi:hypothetical protein
MAYIEKLANTPRKRCLLRERPFTYRCETQLSIYSSAHHGTPIYSLRGWMWHQLDHTIFCVYYSFDFTVTAVAALAMKIHASASLLALILRSVGNGVSLLKIKKSFNFQGAVGTSKETEVENKEKSRLRNSWSRDSMRYTSASCSMLK